MRGSPKRNGHARPLRMGQFPPPEAAISPSRLLLNCAARRKVVELHHQILYHGPATVESQPRNRTPLRLALLGCLRRIVVIA